MRKKYDICIIGAGPASLSVLSALQQPEGILKNDGMWSQWDLNKRKQRSSTIRELSICVIDPASCWLHEWKGRFKSLGIETLRSPAWATPEYFESGSGLLEFAHKTDRENELHDVVLSKSATKLLHRQQDSGLWTLPGAKLFEDFCENLSSELPHTFVKGAAEGIDKCNDGSYDVKITGQMEPVQADAIIFALGAGVPNIPAALSQMHRENDRVVHTLSWMKTSAMQRVGEVVLVIGGGLSAAQAALEALRRGAKRVILMSRRHMQSRHYDLPLEWMDARLGWKVAGKDKDKSAKFRAFEFFECPKTERKAWIRSARGGATIPGSYLEELERISKCDDRLECWVDEIATVKTLQSGLLYLTFSRNNSPIVVDRIILATGSDLDMCKVPLLRRAADRYNLPVISQLPDINEELQWGEENFYVVGALAMLQNGPDSGNLTGCRRAAAICAEKLGAFKSIVDYHSCGPLDNPFSALIDDNEDTASESESSSDSDGEDEQ